MSERANHWYELAAGRNSYNIAKRKKMGALDSCFGLVGPHQQSIPQLLSLASRVYKGKVERSTCGFELIPTKLCSGAALVVLNQ